MNFVLKVIQYFFKILSWIAVAAIVVFIAVAAPLIAGFHPMVVLSGSMEPTYPVGSVVYYKSCSFEELQVGDAITFQAGDSLVTHRITTVNGISRNVITKGDNNSSEDPSPVEADLIKGRTAKIKLPYLGFFVQFCKSPPVLICIAIVLIADYLLGALLSKPETKEKPEIKEE